MNFDGLANGVTLKALGLLPQDGFWLAVILIVLATLLEFFIFKSIRDRRVLGERTIVGATIVLAMISTLCIIGGMLILFY